MQIKNNVKIHNRFDIEIIDKNTGELKQSIVSYNIVLNQMYTCLCGGLSYFVNIHFGSGTGTLSPTRTTLFNHLGTKAAADEEIIKAIPLSVWKRKIVLNPEEYIGNTISEVGIAFGSTNTNLVTHSLLKDSEGNTISIIKTDLDVITIYATVFVTFDTSNPNLTYISMPSSNQLVNYLIGGGPSPTGVFSVLDQITAQSKVGSTATVTWTSDTVLKQRKTNVARFATTVGNGHIKYLEFANILNLLLPYAPVFNGQSYTDVSLGVGDGVKKRFLTPSANVRQSSLVVKKNGVVVSDYVLNDIYTDYRTYLTVPTFVTQFPNGSAVSKNGNTFVFNQGSGLTPDSFVYDLVGDTLVARPSVVDLGNTALSCTVNNDGSVVAFGFNGNPAVAVYDWNGVVMTKRIDPPSLPVAYNVDSISLSQDGNVLAFQYGVAPFIHCYDWNGSAWTKRATPPSVNGTVNSCVISQDGNVLALATNTTPFVNTYDWNGSAWVKRVTPVDIPSASANGIDISIDKNVLAVISNSGTQKIITYDWNGSAWISRPSISNPTNVNSVSLSNNGLTLSIASSSTPFIYTYWWNGNNWVRTSLNSVLAACKSIKSSENNEYIVACNSSNSQPQFFVLRLFKVISIVFNTAPTIGDVLTADYIVDGVHKTDQYVIDASFAIQFGEI